jgi:site-specific DNA recombinase
MIKQDELSKARVVAEAEMNLQGCQQLDVKAVSAHATDLRNILAESEVAQRKAFLRSFVKKIVVYKERARLYYKLPVPPDGRRMEEVRVLSIDTPSEPEGTEQRTFTLAFRLAT